MYKTLDGEVLLLLFGIYFVLKYISEKAIVDILYGILLIAYHFRLMYYRKNKEL